MGRNPHVGIKTEHDVVGYAVGALGLERRFFFKRAIDLVLASAGLLLAAPVLAVLALLVRARLGKPVLFHQERAGLAGRPFILHKIRTMSEAYDSSGRLLSDQERLAPFGATIRALSLDELPELWNILKGDMSLVGPRPLPTAYLPRYTPQEYRRHNVRPGLTGWAQVNGRNALTWEERLLLDVWYVDHWSVWLDFQIMAKTVAAVLSRTGVTAPGAATMPEFRPESELMP